MKKIELASMLVELENLKLEAQGHNRMSETVSNRLVEKNANRYGKAELVEKVTNAQAELERVKESVASEARYNEWMEREGKALLETLAQHELTYRNDIANEIQNILTEAVGDDWGVDFRSNTSFEVGLLETEESKHGLKFGCTFDVYFGYEYDWRDNSKTFKFQANVPTNGSFDIDPNDDNWRFYHGLARFLGNAKAMAELKEELEQYTKNIDDLRNQWYKAAEAIKEGKKVA